MGIPAFYRWLVDRYPLAAADVIEETSTVVNGVQIPIDITKPNPNGFEFDNLYLDMNGIIHPCFHPEELPAPKTYDEVFKAVFKYIDRLFFIVRPRKLLYLAIDGVAPRAKMNQQRTRRFRAAKDAADEASGTERPRGIHESKGEILGTEKLDSNVITPGTEFMELLSLALRYYLHLRMNMHPGWQGIKVILSDANVPGEGEHKIMSYIRLQRNMPGFDPNTRHCVYGLDADLIMLALATHEIHFSILREDVRSAQMNDKTFKKRKKSLAMDRCKVMDELSRMEQFNENIDDFILRQKFQFLHIWVLRDYLAHDLRIPDPTAEADLERLIDDFVFMCLFVGNDFLPHVPSLEISEGAVDLLMHVYKKEFVQMGGYLTSSFEVNLESVEHFVQALGSHENAIFRKRSQVQKQMEIRFRGSLANARKDRATSFKGPSTERSNEKETQKPINMFDGRNSTIDKVKLGEEGCKERYYIEKFEVKTEDDIEGIRRDAVLKYMEGICWVMHYYYQGVCSWHWFYPYYYAPFASDFNGLNQLKIHFTLGEPFKPFDQLMAVLPAASAHALPICYRKLMTDPFSPITDFYPSDFEFDMNGKRHAWQAICKLPFIEESRLLSEITKVEPTLTDDEKQRNSLGLDILFLHISHPLAVMISSFCELNKDNQDLLNANIRKNIDPSLSGGMNGYMYISDKTVCPMEIFSPVDNMETITKNKVIYILYECPSFHSHVPKPPEGVIMPEKSVSKKDLLPQPILWHEKTAIFGRKLSNRPNPKSVSGPCLAKLAHRLVAGYYLAKQQATSDRVGGSNNNGEDGKGKQGNDCDDPADNKTEKMSKGQKKRMKRRLKKSSNLQATMAGVSYDGKNDEDRQRKLSNDGDELTDKICEDEKGKQSNDGDDPADIIIEKMSKGQRKRMYLENSADLQAATDGVSYDGIIGENRNKKQSSDGDEPTDKFIEDGKGKQSNGCDDPTNKKTEKMSKGQRKRKWMRLENSVKLQATKNGVSYEGINGEDIKKKQGNDGDELKDKICEDGKGKQSNDCDDPTANKIKMMSKGQRKRMRTRLRKSAELQSTTDPVTCDCDCINGEDRENKQSKNGDKLMDKVCDVPITTVGVSYDCIDAEDRKKIQSNNEDVLTDKIFNGPTDNKIEKKRKKRRSRNSTMSQAITEAVGESHIIGDDRKKDEGCENDINGEGRKKKQGNYGNELTDKICDDPTDEKIEKKRKKRRRRNSAMSQATTDGVSENLINGEDKKKEVSENDLKGEYQKTKQSNDGDEVTNKICDDSVDYIIVKKSKNHHGRNSAMSQATDKVDENSSRVEDTKWMRLVKIS